MQYFVIIVNGFQLLTIITKSSILDVAAVLDPPLSDILEIDGLLVTLDIETAFDFTNHVPWINTLEKFRFGKNSF